MTAPGGASLPDPGRRPAGRRLAAAPDAGAERGMPLLAAAFAVSLVLPNHFFLGPLRLAPFLLLLLGAFLPLVVLWAGGRAGGVRLPDLMVLGAALWAALALVLHHGLAQGLEPAGVVVLQTFGAYLLGRCAVRGPEAMARLVRTGIVIVALMLPFALYEALTGVRLYLALFAMLGPVPAPVEGEGRLGLERAQVAFEHPILYGIFVASMFGVAWTSLTRPLARVAAAVLVGVATFVSLSTGALLCLAVQVGLLAWNRLLRRRRGRWGLLAALIAAAYVTVDLLSNRTPFAVFADHLTLNASTAYNRLLIWQFGSAEVLENPVFGIGLNDWDRPDWMRSGSIDMFWLFVAMRYGLPALALLGGASLVLMWRAGRRRGLDPLSARLRLGLIVSLIGVFTAIWSVHLWKASFCWMMFLLGCLGWLEGGSGAAGGTARPGAAAGPPDPARRRTWL